MPGTTRSACRSLDSGVQEHLYVSSVLDHGAGAEGNARGLNVRDRPKECYTDGPIEGIVKRKILDIVAT